MKYFILDYTYPAPAPHAKGAVSRFDGSRPAGVHKGWMKWLGKNRIYRKYRQYQVYKNLKPVCRSLNLEEVEVSCITLPMAPRELAGLPAEWIHRCILGALGILPEKGRRSAGQKQDIYIMEEPVCMLETQKELETYIPAVFLPCEDKDEIYVKLLASKISHLCQYGYVQKRSARLLFLDDGSRDVRTYIRLLAADWNYVSVYSSRHESLEALYQELYEEEGLMVECVGPDQPEFCQGDIVIDLMGDWKGIGRIYPPGAHVLDAAFSHRKKEYLRIREVKLGSYQQVLEDCSMHTRNSSDLSELLRVSGH